jgi:hypothetical protein
MQGVIDNALEAHIAETVSLERAWQLWNAGSLSHVTVISVAKRSDCECGGNRDGLICMNSDHMDLRVAMIKGLKGTIDTLRVGDLYGMPSGEEILGSFRGLSTEERGDGVADGEKGDTIA